MEKAEKRWKEDEKENENDENDRENGNNQTGNDRRPALSVQIRLGLRIESGVNAHDENGFSRCEGDYESLNVGSLSRLERMKAA